MELSEQRRQEIIVAALRLFAKRGYRATTMGDIARAMGCSKGLLYHYFASKAELADQARTGAHALMGGRLTAGAFTGLAFKYLQDLCAPLGLLLGVPAAGAALLPVALTLASAWWLLARSA